MKYFLSTLILFFIFSCNPVQPRIVSGDQYLYDRTVCIYDGCEEPDFITCPECGEIIRMPSNYQEIYCCEAKLTRVHNKLNVELKVEK